MNDNARSREIEPTVRALCDRGDHGGAVTCLIDGYGSELLGFLIARLRDEALACDVFSVVSEKLWLGLAEFEWRSSARVFAYAVARNAAATHAKRQGRRRAREVPLTTSGAIEAAVERVRTRTLTRERTEVKDGVRQLREQLSADDQTLLILRVDRGLSWREIAVVLGDGEPDDPGLARESARLRQRFQTIKRTLRARAEEAGLLTSRIES